MRLVRTLAAVLCALMLWSAISAGPTCGSGDCGAECPDDDAEGHCPPSCACSCCPHATPCLPGRATPTLASAIRIVHHVRIDLEPDSVSPSDILHVPIPFLA